ncbi:MAG: hypothetical protein JXR55_05310 [Candidatus Fermentibacteraceae bacterium]|nr:hypothetical protein [Candidatus Fermentibacteraceae bacterium]
MNRLTLNGVSGGPELARDLLKALNDQGTITEKGGFLFKARLETGNRRHLVLGFTPCILHGHRTYHYDSRLPGEDEYTLIGSVTPNHVFEILFRPSSEHLTEDDRQRYGVLYVTFARFLLEQGYHRKNALSAVTVEMIREAGLFASAPGDLPGLAGVPLPGDEGPG